MNDAFKKACDYAETAISYLQTVRIVEIRQSLEFIGVHHVEFLVALLVFLALQFTKFTFVLVLACLIAFIIFYMWDSLFPDLSEDQYKHKKARADPPYGAGYGPNYGVDRAVGSQNRASFVIDSSESVRDARTSALLPPFTTEFGDPSNTNMRRAQRAAGSTFNNNRMQHRRSTMPEAMTPIGHGISTNDIRSNKRIFGNQLEEFKQMRRIIERDPQAFRRRLMNEYRNSRPGVLTDLGARYRYQNVKEDTRPKRSATQNPPDDRSSKGRRGSDNKNALPKRSMGNDQADRFRSTSRENLLRKLRNYPIPTSRTSGINNRLDTSRPHTNPDSRKSKNRSGRSKSITVPINTVIKLGSMYRLVAGNSPQPDAKSSRNDLSLECDCNNDSEGKTIVKLSDSYPYVIEPVYDSSEEETIVTRNDK